MHHNTSNECKLVKILKMTKWMEQTLGKRVRVPGLETIKSGAFELASEESEEGESSSSRSVES